MLEIKYKKELEKIMAEVEEASARISDYKNVPFCQQIKRLIEQHENWKQQQK